MQHRLVPVFLLLVLSSTLLTSCRDSGTVPQAPPEPPVSSTVTDAELVALAAQSGYAFYRNSPDSLDFTPDGGGHGGKIQVRFNAAAQPSLTDNGKLPVGARFPEGSVVVKDIYFPGSYLLAVMLKRAGATNADSGWVWGEYIVRENGVVETAYSASEKGAVCTSCHSLTADSSTVAGDEGHRDHVRTFGLRP